MTDDGCGALTDPASDRITTYPIRFEPEWEMYQTCLHMYWTHHEIDMRDDVQHWNHPTLIRPAAKRMLTYVLAFFAAADGIVMRNIESNFGQEVRMLEAKYFYNFQIMMEQIHAETYSMLLDTFVTDTTRRRLILDIYSSESPDLTDITDPEEREALTTMHAAIRQKIKWAESWMDSSKASLPERIFAWGVVELVMFCSAFAMIFWFKKDELLPGLTASNEFISRDENMHGKFAALIYSRHCRSIPHDRALAIMAEAYESEARFIDAALPKGMTGINAAVMLKHVRHYADWTLSIFGHSVLYGVLRTPLPYMTQLGAPGKANFFERAPTQYSHGSAKRYDRGPTTTAATRTRCRACTIVPARVSYAPCHHAVLCLPCFIEDEGRMPTCPECERPREYVVID